MYRANEDTVKRVPIKKLQLAEWTLSDPTAIVTMFRRATTIPPTAWPCRQIFYIWIQNTKYVIYGFFWVGTCIKVPMYMGGKRAASAAWLPWTSPTIAEIKTTLTKVPIRKPFWYWSVSMNVMASVPANMAMMISWPKKPEEIFLKSF